MKKKGLFVAAIVIMIMIATTITAMARGNIIQIEDIQKMKRAIPLLAAIASAALAKGVAVIARRLSEQGAKSEVLLNKEAKVHSN